MAVQNSLTPTTAGQKAVEKKQKFSAYLNGQIGTALVGNAISDKRKQDRFKTALISLVSNNPSLQACESASLISAALQSEALGLPLNAQLGFSYVIPFKDNKNNRTVAQFQVGVRGLEQLAYRSGQVRKLKAVVVKEGELVSYNPITDEVEFKPIADPKERAKAKTIGYYAFFFLTNNTTDIPNYAQFFYKEEIEEHAEKYSQGYKAHKGYTFWEKNFDVMALKTCLKQILKHCPASVDGALADALVYDQAVINADNMGGVDYIDGVENDIETPVADDDGVIQEAKVEETPAVGGRFAGASKIVEEEVKEEAPAKKPELFDPSKFGK